MRVSVLREGGEGTGKGSTGSLHRALPWGGDVCGRACVDVGGCGCDCLIVLRVNKF